ncbi:MAG TPA: tetratricopeptide repeat protein [Xanthobacteraceae bacterium]|nr:tetratricopeptide repeat protein [Xanthobacteraceae bacterium]
MSPDRLFAEALALLREGKAAQAARLSRQILARAPRHLGALNVSAVAASQLGNAEEAERALRQAIEIDGRSEMLHYNHGTVLRQLGRLEEALASLDRAVALNPGSPDSWTNRGAVLRELGRPSEALESFARSLALRPNHAETLFNRGNALAELRQLSEAIAVYQQSLALRADPAVLVNLGNTLRELGRGADALAAYDRAFSLDPTHSAALQARCQLLMHEARYGEAIATAERALAADPGASYMIGHLIHAKSHLCDWNGLDDLERRLHRDLAAGRKVCPPFALLAIDSTPSEQLTAARIWTADRYPPARQSYRHGKPHDRARLRVGYMAGEYRMHPTSLLVAELFELHDRTRFEIVGVSTGASDGSALRRRLEAAFDDFIDAEPISDDEAARLINQKGIDILVDLNAHSGNVRAGILARRPAPIQVNYLAFPGTCGAPYVDYILADRWVIPPDQQQFYSEQVVYLPDSYQVNDASRGIAAQTPRRAAMGLPEDAFVFCCFNSVHKIVPAWFEVWTTILRQVEGSVLWLLGAGEIATRNLRREAEQRGIAADRLVFAERMALPEHLARHRHADLFLDTLPYNAHTTASDALWAGLPVLTCAGHTFAGRVAAGLLDAVGLADMIVTSPEAYVETAVRLAREPQMLRALRQRLDANRLTHPLFDSQRFARQIESAYATMWARYREDAPPAGFAVGPLPAAGGDLSSAHSRESGNPGAE